MSTTQGEQRDDKRDAERRGSADANHDMHRYARALRTGIHENAVQIEMKWGLYGYSPEVVSTVLSCVATGLSLESAINVATQP